MISDKTQSIIDGYEARVVAMDDPEIIKTALKLAYYSAMLDAAMTDPMDDPEDQQELLAQVLDRMQENTAKFQQLVDDKL